MSDLIQIKGGIGDVPELEDRELAIKKNGINSELFCGVNGENIRLCGANDITNINTEINNILAEISNIKTTIAEINSIKTAIAEINGAIATINTRLDALETPSE